MDRDVSEITYQLLLFFLVSEGHMDQPAGKRLMFDISEDPDYKALLVRPLEAFEFQWLEPLLAVRSKALLFLSLERNSSSSNERLLRKRKNYDRCS